jgi:cytochrome c-type biogenesis protein CcmH/NrfF
VQGLGSHIQLSQLPPQFRCMRCDNAALIASRKEFFDTFVAKAFDH